VDQSNKGASAACPQTNTMSDISRELQQAVEHALHQNIALNISGSGSKAFYGRQSEGIRLDVTGHQGIISYEPTELVMTARCGTPLTQIEALLAEHRQMLPFDPPHFSDRATLGGAVACGLSGPRRPFSGAVRDCVLGCTLINGQADILSFGGEVMKNVAGYDIARLMVGAMGTLGLLLSASFKVLPRPAEEITLSLKMDPIEAIETMNQWAGQPLPLSGLCFDGSRVYARLCGAAESVALAQRRLGGERLTQGERFWYALREQEHSFFQGKQDLWRLSIAPGTPMMDLPGEWLLDWGGAQRWLKTEAPAAEIFGAAEWAGGHATLFRSDDRSGERFQPLPATLMKYHQQLKQAFDPNGLFNPKRMYSDW
jgi:glycolate dehydrogenase FAD-binding subunit